MIYVHEVAIVNHRQPELYDVRGLCKEVAPEYVRRTDRFIQLGVLGVQKIKAMRELPKNTALFLTSGQGNVAVFKRLCDQYIIGETPPKPVDFINSLSNTACFYIARYLALNSRSINMHNHGFAVQMAIALADCDLRLGREQQILLGGIDQYFEPAESARRYLGLNEGIALGEGSNWMLVSKERLNAQASIEVVNKSMTAEQLMFFMGTVDEAVSVAFGLRFPDALIDLLLKEKPRARITYESQLGFYETAVLYVINSLVQSGIGKYIHIEYLEDRFRVLELEVY